MTRIVLFCGGRGSATIIRALLRQSDVELTLLVNAYDDGLSTGALRNFIPGMLGPSDFRKNLSCDNRVTFLNIQLNNLPRNIGTDLYIEVRVNFSAGRNTLSDVSLRNFFYAHLGCSAASDPSFFLSNN